MLQRRLLELGTVLFNLHPIQSLLHKAPNTFLLMASKAFRHSSVTEVALEKKKPLCKWEN